MLLWLYMHGSTFIKGLLTEIKRERVGKRVVEKSRIEPSSDEDSSASERLVATDLQQTGSVGAGSILLSLVHLTRILTTFTCLKTQLYVR